MTELSVNILIIYIIEGKTPWCLDFGKSLNITPSKIKSHFDQEELELGRTRI